MDMSPERQRGCPPGPQTWKGTPKGPYSRMLERTKSLARLPGSSVSLLLIVRFLLAERFFRVLYHFLRKLFSLLVRYRHLVQLCRLHLVFARLLGIVAHLSLHPLHVSITSLLLYRMRQEKDFMQRGSRKKRATPHIWRDSCHPLFNHKSLRAIQPVQIAVPLRRSHQLRMGASHLDASIFHENDLIHVLCAD